MVKHSLNLLMTRATIATLEGAMLGELLCSGEPRQIDSAKIVLGRLEFLSVACPVRSKTREGTLRPVV